VTKGLRLNMGSVLEQPFRLLLIKSNRRAGSLHQCHVRALFLSKFVKMPSKRKADSSSCGKKKKKKEEEKKDISAFEKQTIQLKPISIPPLFLRACGNISCVFQTARGHLSQPQHKGWSLCCGQSRGVNMNQEDNNRITALEIQPCL